MSSGQIYQPGLQIANNSLSFLFNGEGEGSREKFNELEICSPGDVSTASILKVSRCTIGRLVNGMYCELERDARTYQLSAGKWYAVDRDFVASVNRSYDEILNYSVSLPEFKDPSEGEYNKRVAKEMADYFVLMASKEAKWVTGPRPLSISLDSIGCTSI